MTPTCERCGRALAVPPSAAPGTHARVTCSCGHTGTIPVPWLAAPPRARETEPLPSPREGNLEVDPWSLPPPEDGYENLVLDDGPAAAGIGAAAEPAVGPDEPSDPAVGSGPERAAAPDIASSVAAEAEATGEHPAPVARPRSRGAILAAAVAAVAAVAAGAWLVAGRARPGPPAGAVRVTVEQDVSWAAAPPLAPVDPSYVERRRPSASSQRAPSPSPPPRAPAAPPRSRAAVAPPPAEVAAAPVPAPAAEAEPPPPPPEASPPPPEPAPVVVPAASVEIPLPPPPVAATPRQVPAGRARAPVLETRSCVEDALRVPRALEGRLPRELVMQVQVGEDGRPANVAFPGAVDPSLRAALSSAVRTCRFAPGAGADGRPAAAATTMRVRFE
ncbi:MAG TPA: hypothetical protein VFL83_05340 [Anaeromyxobacter sp.]|nr:hypothetical protein [Anaeromyxobacter sp.]